MKINQYWFKPKRFGLGAQPTSWEGWVLTLGYIAFIIGAVRYYIPDSPGDFTWAMVLSTVALIYITKQKTEGGWKWRWGKKST